MAVIKPPVTSKGGGATVGFPDVCKTPAPPAPFAPIPYPNAQLQENLQKANKVDAQASAGDPRAIALQKEAVNNLKKSTGDEAVALKGVVSATAAVQMGYTLHKGGVGKPRAGKKSAIDMGMSKHAKPMKWPRW